MLKKTILVIILFAINILAYGNGDPVTRFSSINRVRNPEPLAIPDIRIVSEHLKITHVDGYNCFDVTYLFKNESNKDITEIDYGFPIDYLIIDELETYSFQGDYISESSHEVGWDERLIKDISFTFDNTELPFHCAKESVKDISFGIHPFDDKEEELVPFEGVNRRWFYTHFSMKPRQEAKFNIRYKVYANAETSAADYWNDFTSYYRYDTSSEYGGGYNLSFLNRYCPQRFQIIYDFSPAKHFGEGKPYNLETEIDLSNLDNPVIRSGNTFGDAKKINRFDYNVKAAEIEPIDLIVYLSKSSTNEFINRAIDKFTVSETEYKVTTNTGSTNIDLKKPRFVSDLACNMDTTGVKQIDAVVTFADGSQNQYRFERKNQDKDVSFSSDNVPILLTITDIYDDMKIRSNAKDDLRIKNIKLTLDSAPTSSFKGVKVIDAR